MVTLKCSYVVKPAEPTLNMNLYISECDQFEPISHATIVYFYQTPCGYPFESALEKLKNSLSQVLVPFFPLAGRLRWIEHDRVELECNSMGAKLYEAESSAKIEDFGDFSPTPAMAKLVPSVDYNAPIHEMPLLLVQLTKLGCGGIALGLGLSHVVADGTSALHMAQAWASIARGEPLGITPVIDRTVMQATRLVPSEVRFDHLEFSPLPVLIGKSDAAEEREKEATVAMLKLTKAQVEKLKNKANDGEVSDGRGGRSFSRYEAVTGHIWRCTCKARKLQNEQKTNVRIIVDCRHRLQPPVPPAYLGNAIFPTMATSSAGEVVSKPLSYAASGIRAAVEKMTDEYIRSAIEYLRTQRDFSRFRYFDTVWSTTGPFYGNPNLAITSWIGLPAHNADFGWGKEIHMGPGVIGFEGKFYILPGPGRDGSLLIALRLQAAHRDAFKKYFYEDIDHKTNSQYNESINGTT